ncbi:MULTISPECIES: SigE family RNA polymerase sigma factor [Pseudofrankia]|uniref:SigE family RNA polymerase sigma factor n=1 Tax=Pseudofrankia TaxID=2994363 RepID=UPI000234D705|nr:MULTISPECIES: SigE family RNA polymerase sigma factor [Pseudofrankia]OHV36958.1 RNA polymerase subunit sigma-24 [Pseudofrankia sp. EUN1h]
MRADDERAFEEFVARTANRQLLSAVLLTGGDWAAAEDLVQGAFERVYLRWDKIGAGREDAYLRRAVVNGATSRWRRLRARVSEVPLVVDGEWTADVASTGPDHADRMTQRDSLVGALRALPPRQRAVVVLRYIDDLAEADVAAALGCSLGSVRSQASRGLAKLRASEHLRALDPAVVSGRVRAMAPPGAPDILTNEPRSQTAAPVATAAQATKEDTR